jgi:RNA polymerase sigma-70 factor (ECF subfamily)
MSGAGDDAGLVAAAKAGDRRAVETLLFKYEPTLFRFGMKMCGNADDAGEVVQETLLAATKSLADFRGEASVPSWLYTIARSFCTKQRRTSKFAPDAIVSLEESAGGLASPAPNPEEAAARREMEALVNGALAKLELPYREVLVLRDLEDLSAAETAEVLGLSVAAVKSRLHRARQLIREHLAPALGYADKPAADGCPDVVALFSRRLEGDLDPGVCAEMETHLAACPRCKGACDSLRETLAACRTATERELPAARKAALRKAIRRYLDAR